MSLNFPFDPNPDEIFSNGERTWQWNGRYWKGISTTVGYGGSVGYTGSASFEPGYVGSFGYTGSRGATGLGFNIGKTYSSKLALEADTLPVGILPGQFGIVSSNENDPDNNRLYLWNGYTWTFITDLSGAQGIKGEIGFSGSFGYSGSVGYIGSFGYTGSRGVGLSLKGNIATASVEVFAALAPFTQGDSYIALDTRNLWVYTNSLVGISGFDDTGAIVGPQGYDGSFGYSGSLGYIGSQGIVGFIGSFGYSGSLGYVGSRGYTGSEGYIGSQGITGYSGSLGYIGSQGITGYVGSSAPGYAGSQGAGFTGSRGTSGYMGSRGDAGYTGSTPSNLIFEENTNLITLTEFRTSIGESVRIRTAQISGEGVFSLLLATFTPTFVVSGLPSSSLSWDVACTGFSVTVINPTDYISRYISSVASLTAISGSLIALIENYNAPSASPTPEGGVTWAQTFSTQANPLSYIRSTSTTSAGGSASFRVYYNATSNFVETAYTTEYSLVTINWATPSVGVTTPTLSGLIFLQTYTSVAYTVSITGMNSPSNYVLSVTPTGGTVSSSVASGTFTFTNAIHKNNRLLSRSLAISAVLTRPSAVTGSSYSVTITGNSGSVSSSASFIYPSFWVFTSSTANPPTQISLINVASFDSDVTVLGDQVYVFSSSITNSDAVPKAFWFGVRAAAIQPSVFKTGASSTLLSDVTYTASSVFLTPDAIPANYIAENYNLYGIVLQPGATFVSIS